MPPVKSVPSFHHPLHNIERGTLWHLATHYAGGPIPEVELHLEPSAPSEDDIPIAERLMNVFHVMIEHEKSEISPENRPNGGVWEMAKHEYHGEFYSLMARRDVPGLAAYLRNAMRETVSHGLGPGLQVFEAFATDGDGRDANIILTLDRLASLAEAVGAAPFEGPEQGPYGENIRIPAADLVAAIEFSIGEIHRPAVMGLFGLALDGGRIIDVRVPDDAYCVHKMGLLSRALGVKTVCEIGGGFGGNAFQAIRSGTFNRYTIVDLPSICILQGYFLMKTFGGDSVAMFGEAVPFPRRISIMPYWEFFRRERQFDLVFNRDSMPEMPNDRAKEYLDEIVARRATFFSVNQESGAGAGQVGWKQLNVRAMVGDTMIQLSRSPYWTRKGYVEEVFVPR